MMQIIRPTPTGLHAGDHDQHLAAALLRRPQTRL